MRHGNSAATHRRGLAGGGFLAAGFDEARAEADLDQLAQVSGGPRWVRAAADAHNVARDLHWGEDESPRKTPPAEEQGEKHAADLAFGRAGAARELRGTAPTGQHQSRPDPMNAVNIHGAQSAA